MSGRPQDATGLVLGITAAIATVGLTSFGAALACHAPEEAAAAPIVPGPIGAAMIAPDAGCDAPPPTLAADPARVPYPLDDLPRGSSDGCPEVALVDHPGAPAPWRPAIRVSPVFAPSVRALEALIDEAAREVYGQSPTTLLSASGYRCSTVRGRPERISEHALGNAIDVRGIELGPERTITVRDQWQTEARFFRLVIVRAHDRGLFRGIIGPPRADHLDHLHFDQGPSSFLDLVLP